MIFKPLGDSYFLKRFRMFDTDVAISVALAIAVSALTAVVATVSVTFSAAVFAFAVRAERSTLFTRFVRPFITFVELVSFTRLFEPRIVL